MLKSSAPFKSGCENDWVSTQMWGEEVVLCSGFRCLGFRVVKPRKSVVVPLHGECGKCPSSTKSFSELADSLIPTNLPQAPESAKTESST